MDKDKTVMKTPKPKKFDLGIALVIGAAVFQAYQFGRALYVYDPAGWSIAGVNVGGLFLGAIVNVIVVLAATRLPSLLAAAMKLERKSKKSQVKNERKLQRAGMQARFAQGAFFGLLILSPLLVAPAMYILWIALPLAPMLVGSLAIGWASAPDIAIALGGFVAGQPLVGVGSESPARAARTTSDGTSQSVGRAKKSDGHATDSAKSANSAAESGGLRPRYPRMCAHCASDSPFAVLKSPNAVGAHMKKHHPELCKTKASEQFVAMVSQSASAKVEP